MSHFAHYSEENYLKTLYKLSSRDIKKLNNTTLAKALDLNPATVLEMVRKMAAKGLVQLQQDKSIRLSEKGKKKALLTIRKHRLWEVFLVEKLKYKWNEVHELAEQLEHIDSASLTDRLEQFLGNPAFDPHGDPIPDKQGRLRENTSEPLLMVTTGKTYRVTNLDDTADSFLDYLDGLELKPGSKIKLVERNEYDQSCLILFLKKSIQLSEKVARNILVQPA